MPLRRPPESKIWNKNIFCDSDLEFIIYSWVPIKCGLWIMKSLLVEMTSGYFRGFLCMWLT